MSELFEYESKLTQIQTEKELAAANLSAINRRLAALRGVEDGLDAKERSPEVAQLKDEINQLEIRKQRLIDQFGNDYSELSSIDEKIESKRKEMVKHLIEASVGESGLSDGGNPTLWENINERKIEEELTVYTLESQEKYYQRLLNNLKKKHPRMMAQAMELMRLTRTKTVSEKVYDFLLEKGEEVKIQAATGTGGIRIIDPPILPREPVPVNTLRNIIFGVLLGLGFGFGFAYLREYSDNSIRTQEDITSFLNLPVMGIIPEVLVSNGLKTRLSFLNNGKKALRKAQKHDTQLKKLESRNLISRMKSKDPIVESYRSLRSNLQFASPDKPIQTMIITSPNPSEGKTITTANLGIVFALLGKKVIIVDTDLRKPKQHILFGIDRSPGLTNCLVEDLSIEEVTYPTGIENLSLIPSGKMPPNPAEILSTQKMNEIIEKIHAISDLVLFDSPPLVAVTDPMILASKLENILLVVKHRGTNREVALNMVEQLKKAKVNIVGVVMNQASLTRGYGYYKYYSRYYK